MDEIKSPLKAIKQFCFECVGENKADVKGCTSKTCPLKPFRMGKNPFIKKEMSEEQRLKAKERLAEARKKAQNV